MERGPFVSAAASLAREEPVPHRDRAVAHVVDQERSRIEQRKQGRLRRARLAEEKVGGRHQAGDGRGARPAILFEGEAGLVGVRDEEAPARQVGGAAVAHDLPHHRRRLGRRADREPSDRDVLDAVGVPVDEPAVGRGLHLLRVDELGGGEVEVPLPQEVSRIERGVADQQHEPRRKRPAAVNRLQKIAHRERRLVAGAELVVDVLQIDQLHRPTLLPPRRHQRRQRVDEQRVREDHHLAGARLRPAGRPAGGDRRRRQDGGAGEGVERRPGGRRPACSP